MGNRPQLGPDQNPGGARWCTDHPTKVSPNGRLECTKNRSKGRGLCHAPAIRGTNACKLHGGHTRAVAKAKGEATITAWSAVGKALNPVDSGMAVLGMLQQSWLRANAYSQLLRQQVVKDGLVPDPDNFDPENFVEKDGLIGYRFGAAGKDGTIYAVSEEVRALVVLEAQERDRVVKYAETAHKMGISERITSLAERWGDLVINRILLVLDGLDLTERQQMMVPALIQAHLGQIDVNAIGSGEGS